MNNERNAQQFQELVKALVGITSPDLMTSFLHDLCTSAELSAMGQRLEVARMVRDGLSYQEIARQTGASTATVTRVAHWLRSGEGGYQAILGTDQ
jgi:TrpR-related protein YerC/YecD